MIDIFAKDGLDQLNFDKVVLRVNDNIQKLELGEPLKHSFIGGNVFNESLQFSVIPNEFSSAFINDIEKNAVYEFFATEDITFKGIRFKDLIRAENVMYSIDGSEFQSKDLPIEIKKGQSLKIGFSFHSDEATEMSYLTTNIFFDYALVGSKKDMYNSAIIVFDPVFPITDGDLSKLNKLIDFVAR